MSDRGARYDDEHRREKHDEEHARSTTHPSRAVPRALRPVRLRDARHVLDARWPVAVR
jgi:hypothetical protein